MASTTGEWLRPLSEHDNAHDLTSSQLHILKLVSLTAGSISILSVITVSVWFIRMRRRFRHDLIMLLLQSDMLKALWFTIYPAVELSTGRAPTASGFCQASGFFLTLGIEACDCAVLLLAAHTSLHICRRSNGNGLYPFKRYAFAMFAGVPVLLTSLAFQNTPAFANSGEYCYLPMRPNWTRVALSWIPRYIVFGAILLMYVWIYVHVRCVTKPLEPSPSTRESSDPDASGRSRWEPRHTASVPPLPSIQRHGLIPSPTPSPTASLIDGRKRNSLASTIGNALGRRPSDSTCTRVTKTPGRPVLGWKLPSFRSGDRATVTKAGSADIEARRRASSASSKPVPSLTRPGQRIKWKRPTFGFDANDSVNNNSSLPDEAGPRRHTAPCVLPLRYVDIEMQDLQSNASASNPSSSNKEEDCVPNPLTANIDVIDHQDKAESFRSNQAAASEISPRMSTHDELQTRDEPASHASLVTQTFWNRPLTDLSRDTLRSPSIASLFAALRRGPRSSRTSSSVFLSPTELAQTGMAETREALRRQTHQLLIYPAVYLAVWICPFVSHLLGGRNVPFPLIVLSLFSLSIQGAADALVFAIREKPWRQIKTDHETERGRRFRAWRGARYSQTADFGRTPDEALANERMARHRLNEEIEQRRSEKNESERYVSGTVDWWELRTAQYSL